MIDQSDIASRRGVVPRRIKGFRDIDENLNRLRWQVIDRASAVYRSYGFEQLDTPVLEYAECLGKYLPDKDSVDEGVYSFKNPEEEPVLGNRGEELRDYWDKVVMDHHFLSLRYDLTAPLARVYAERLWSSYLKGVLSNGSLPLFRRYQFGPVFRYEKKIDASRFREFWQLDFDSVGTSDMATDGEVCMVLADAMESIGLDRGKYIVRVNNRKILKGFLGSLGVSDVDTENAILRVLDKTDKIGVEEMVKELGMGRSDPGSGSQISGLGLDSRPDINFRLLIDSLVLYYEDFQRSQSRRSVLDKLDNLSISNESFLEGVRELTLIDHLLSSMGFDEERVEFAPVLVRGMEYYTGPVFEVESTETISEDGGKMRSFGSICGGGRYDGLVERLLGIKAPATGASIGVDRLCELLRLKQTELSTRSGPVFIARFGQANVTRLFELASQIRGQGVGAEVYLGDQQSLKKQLAYADKRNSPLAILIGDEELARGIATVKDLRLGSQLTAVASKSDWQSQVQKEVPIESLAEYIRRELSESRQGE